LFGHLFSRLHTKQYCYFSQTMTKLNRCAIGDCPKKANNVQVKHWAYIPAWVTGKGSAVFLKPGEKMICSICRHKYRTEHLEASSKQGTRQNPAPPPPASRSQKSATMPEAAASFRAAASTPRTPVLSTGSSKVLTEGAAAGLFPLSKIKVAELRKLLGDRGKNDAGLKDALLRRLLALSKEAPPPLDAAADVARLYKDLQAAVKIEFSFREQSSWKGGLSLPELQRHAANARLRVLQKSSLREGFVSRCPADGAPLGFYDAYHLFHNMVTLVIFGSDSGDVLNQKNIRAAAEATGDFLLISVANAKVDKHSHMATHFFLTSNALTAELRLRGHFQDAVVLETFGRASIAWLRPGRTEEWRTKALHACNLLLFRIMGRAMHDVAAIRATKKRAMGFTINQLMDLLANNEARIRWLRTLSASERSAAKETAVTTRYVESFFSKLMANKGSGEKMTQNEIQGVVCKLDALLLLMRTAGKGFTIAESRRKRKFVEGTDANWNDGTVDDDACAFVRDYFIGVHDFTEEEATWVAVGMRDYLEKDFLHGLRARVKGYVSGRTSVREHNKKFKKEGQGQCE